jgi:phosphoribosylaminoimidazole (AIR) synthetase
VPAAPELFALIASAGDVDDATMYATLNMGIGFCVVVGKDDERAALDALKAAGEDAIRIGTVTERPGRTVTIPAAGLVGKGDAFQPVR